MADQQRRQEGLEKLARTTLGDDMFNLTLKTIEEVNLVLGALGELPAKTSMNLIAEIVRQVNPQLPKEQTKAEGDKVE